MKTLLISVGGSPDPIIKVLKEKKPEKVVFFTSQGSRTQVEEKILPEIGYFPTTGHVVTPDHEDVGKCTFELLKNVPEEMRKLGVEKNWPEICGYTGGTKAMSAAVVWAASRHPCELIYVGGISREKEGIGIVKSGSEKIVCTENPWNQVAWYETALARELFNRGQYANAAEIISSVRKRVTDSEAGRVLDWLKNMFEAFYAWDTFDHKKANGQLGKTLKDQSLIQISRPELKGFCEQSEVSLKFLKSIPPGKASSEMALDLLANAQRREELEHKYEDAVARCYSATEKLAKVQLKDKWAIDNSKARLDQIPEVLRDEYRHYVEGGEVLKFGLKASFKLLAELGDPMGIAYMKQEAENGKILGQRNESILGHGSKPVDRKNFNAFFKMALSVAGVHRDDLIPFPRFS